MRVRDSGHKDKDVEERLKNVEEGLLGGLRLIKDCANEKRRVDKEENKVLARRARNEESGRRCQQRAWGGCFRLPRPVTPLP